jgi:phosphoglycerate dehydrogenase-like enzyme
MDKVVWTAPWLTGWNSFKPDGMIVRETFTADKLRFIPRDTRAWICNPSASFIINHDVLDRFECLDIVVTPSTGNNHISLEALCQRGIAFRSLLDDRKGLDEIRASSEFTFFMILAALRRPDKAIQYNYYERDEEFLRGHELYGKSVGIIGLGRIGKNIMKWCGAFGVNKFFVVDKDNKPEDWKELFSHADIIVVSCSLNDATRGFLGVELLELMKPNSYIINTARGEVFGAGALEWFLNRRSDVTAALDVIPGEVINTQGNSLLLSLENVVVTPHIAGTTFESQEKAARISLKLLEEYYGTKDVGISKDERKEVRPS